MSDWWFVAVSALWILGLSIVLAAFSYHDWLRRGTGRRWKEVRARHGLVGANALGAASGVLRLGNRNDGH